MLLLRLYNLDTDGYCWVAEEGEDFYKIINGISHGESEPLYSLLFMIRNLLTHFSLGEVSGRWVTRDGPLVGFPLVYTGSPSRSIAM